MSTHTHHGSNSSTLAPAVRQAAMPRTHRALRFRRRTRAADALVVTCWASAAAAVALFLGSGGAAQFDSLGAALSSLGILAGLVGTDLILVMLVLAARIPLIDHAVGHDRAMALHGTLGKPALYLLLGHAALLIAGWAVAEGINPLAETISMFSLPDMPLAFLGLGLLVAVVVSSVVAVRRKFPYEVWHLIHLLSYAAVLVALPHQLSTGGILTEGSVERVYWIALYILALGSILTFRFIEPVVVSVRHRIVVDRVETISPGVANIYLSGRDLNKLRGAGGQYFVWRFWTGSTWWHAHPLSLSAAPSACGARITVRALGKGSAQLADLPRGTRAWIEGPYGLFTDAARTAPKLAIVAAGIGITPVRALLEDSPLEPDEATILLRASTPAETYLWDEMRYLASRSSARLYTSVGRRGDAHGAWLSADDHNRGVGLASVFPELSSSDLYVCGPQVWTDLVVAEARAAGLPPHQIHTERFDW